MNPSPPSPLRRWFCCAFLAGAALAASPAGAQNAKGGLRAGAATSNITPLMGVPLDGTIMQIGPARHVHDELHARCLVLDDGTTKLALVVADCTMISRDVIDRAKALATEHTGIPAGNILISATHTHSTPRALTGLSSDPLHGAYLDYLAIRISEAIRRAVNQLSPAQVGWASFAEPRFVQNRRWFVEGAQARTNPFGETGEEVVMNPGKEGLIRPAGPVDPEVFLLSVRHADGRPLALLANYGLHYVGGIPGGTVSADYFGVFAGEVTRRLDAVDSDPPFVAIMSNGTSGDVNAVDPIKGAAKAAPYERMKAIAASVAEGAVAALEGLDYRSDLTLAARNSELTLAIRRPDETRLAWARETAVEGPAALRLTRPQIYAREALALAEYPETLTLPLQAFRIGDLAVAAIPNEVFAETGLAIKSGSPFPGETFTIELANGSFGYLPSETQHRWGGYETWPARSSLLEVKAEEKIRTTIGKLLGELKGSAR